MTAVHALLFQLALFLGLLSLPELGAAACALAALGSLEGAGAGGGVAAGATK